ncbi:MAG: c-type cytochrome [Planctomycetaceae bacterium]|nr:c-type cytochrome [Planctomycetaceae bacterium]
MKPSACVLSLLALASVCLYGTDLAAQELEFSRWSGELNVPDPVAIAFDDAGSAFVTQTQRRKIQDLDIRQHRAWVPDDVGLSTVEHKRAFLRQTLAIGNDAANKKHVQDHNKDGHFDWRDLTVISERIHRLRDTDKDGTADEIRLFAEDFRTEVTGIAAGVLAFDGRVFATVAPDVWTMTDTDHNGTADERSIVATGFGLHIAYAGHDMHGLTVGPDGRIYWSIGDKGISVTTADGRRHHYPNQGGVMRCNPDGSGFEVFAHGLRNVQELAFDEYGNLFGVDNDADKPGEKERFVYIVRDMDAGWRCHYQYRGDDYDPWMDEGLWRPHHSGQPSYIVPPIVNYKDGPAGFTYNPGHALSVDWQRTFFLTSAPKGEQWAFQTQPDGASFTMVNSRQIGNGVPLVGINFGPDGGLYGVDWGGGYPLNQKGAVWKMDVARPDEAVRQQTAALIATDFQYETVERMLELLEYGDQRVRLKCQFELARRRQLEELVNVVQGKASTIAKCHAIWGLGQLGRLGEPRLTALSRRALVDLLESADDELVAQSLRTLAELPMSLGHVAQSEPGPAQTIVREFADLDPLQPAEASRRIADLLRHSSRRVRFFAACALRHFPSESARGRLQDYAAELKLADTYERFALSQGLQGCSESWLCTLKGRSDSRILKLAAVVALRRLQSAKLAYYLSDADQVVATEAALAVHDDFSVPDALPALARRLNKTPHTVPALLRRTINANFRLGDADSAVRLATFAASEKHDLPMRLAALDALRHWSSPPPLDKVTGRHRTLTERDYDRERIASPMSSVLTDGNAQLRAAAISAASALAIVLQPDALTATVADSESPLDLRMAALDALKQQSAVGLPQVATDLLRDPAAGARIAGLELLAEISPTELPPELHRVLTSSDSIEERQTAVRLIAKTTGDEQAQLLNGLRDAVQARRMPELWLESAALVEAGSVDARKAGELQSAITALRTDTEVATKEHIADFIECQVGGNVARGKKLFETHLEAQCIRCHRTGKKGSNVGPVLSEIGTQRRADELLQSIVAPSAVIDPKYRTQVVVLISGRTIQGVKQKETDTTLSLADNQGKTIDISKDDIDDVFEQNVSIMPEMKKALSKREIRDLVAYLQSLKQAS